MKKNFLFDLGFHHGEGLKYLWELYEVDETWTVFAFEPNSTCRRALLRANALLLPRVTAMPFAVHTAAGPAVFQREAAHPGGAEDGLGSHLTGLGFELDPHGAGAEPVWKVDFPLLLRALIAPGREYSLVVVKMDIEGAEYDILRAALRERVALVEHW